MLLIEKLTVCDGRSVKASCFFTGREWFFQGHYPEDPVVPGAILCEIMAQASCGLFIDSVKGSTPYLVSIDDAKFRKTVRPRDTVTVESNFLHTKGPFYFAKCGAYVGEILCAECRLSFVVKKSNGELERRSM